MTHAPAASPNRPAPAQPAASDSRAASRPEPPRQQAETRAARERFAARLERDNPRDAGKTERDDSSRTEGRRDRVHEREQDRSGLADNQNEAGADGHSGLALAQPATQLLGVGAVTSVSAVSAPPVDPALIERFAAQIAEVWPTAAVETVRIQFPAGGIITGASLSREADGSMAIRLTGLDPRITALQSARLQLDLATALTRRRLRVGTLQFEGARPGQRGGVRSDPGAASTIDRVV